MEKVTYTEFGITSTISNYKPLGKALIGMRSGKPFTENGKIFINLNKEINEVLDIEFKDESGNILERDAVELDTTTYAIGVIIKEDNVLIIKRIKPDLVYHVFPGGHVRENEEVEEALIREMQEEVGVDITKYKFEKVTEHHKEGFGPEKVFFIYVGDDELEVNEAEPDDPDSPLFWHPIAEMENLENVFQAEVAAKLSEYISKQK